MYKGREDFGEFGVWKVFHAHHYLGRPASLSLAARPGNGGRGCSECLAFRVTPLGVSIVSRVGVSRCVESITPAVAGGSKLSPTATKTVFLVSAPKARRILARGDNPGYAV